MEMKQESDSLPIEGENFGPPRDHSVILDGVRPIQVRQLGPRVGIVSEINSDAEMINNDQTEHHIINVN